MEVIKDQDLRWDLQEELQLDLVELFSRTLCQQCMGLVDQKTSHILDLSYHIAFSNAINSSACQDFMNVSKHCQVEYSGGGGLEVGYQIEKTIIVLVLVFS